MALGVLTLVVALILSTSLAAWMSPTIAGLLLAIPLSWASGKLALGMAMRRMGLLVTPEEGDRPRVAARAAEIEEQSARDGAEHVNALVAIHKNPILRDAHEKMLPPATRRQRGEIYAERVIAEAKLIDATCIDDAVAWLKPAERMVILHDRALIDMLTRLPKTADAATA
jgi:membrane glycosyltransferase